MSYVDEKLAATTEGAREKKGLAQRALGARARRAVQSRIISPKIESGAGQSQPLEPDRPSPTPLDLETGACARKGSRPPSE